MTNVCQGKSFVVGIVVVGSFCQGVINMFRYGEMKFHYMPENKV